MLSYDDVMCLFCVLIYGSLFYEMASSRPRRKRKKSGTWHQDDARGATHIEEKNDREDRAQK